MSKPDQELAPTVAGAENVEPWIKPEIISFAPVGAAEGISFKPNDGLSNLS